MKIRNGHELRNDGLFAFLAGSVFLSQWLHRVHADGFEAFSPLARQVLLPSLKSDEPKYVEAKQGKTNEWLQHLLVRRNQSLRGVWALLTQENIYPTRLCCGINHLNIVWSIEKHTLEMFGTFERSVPWKLPRDWIITIVFCLRDDADNIRNIDQMAYWQNVIIHNPNKYLASMTI